MACTTHRKRILSRRILDGCDLAWYGMNSKLRLMEVVDSPYQLSTPSASSKNKKLEPPRKQFLKPMKPLPSIRRLACSPFFFWHLSEGKKMKRPEIEMLCHLGIFLITTIFLGAAHATAQNLPILAFEEGYTQLFGDTNLMLHRDGKTVHLSLDQRTGSGFVSQDLYLHGFFSTSIKLPSDYTAGVVVAFYLSNGDIYEKNHDELDFEFLGNIRGKEWRIQTNVYGNGSTGIGREERYGLWFDPTEDFHKYSILWTADQIIFFVDNIPIRKIRRTEAMSADFPSKPMSLYATIWDGSNWATSGGRYKVNYKYAPYTADFSDLILHGCTVDPIQHSPRCGDGENSLQSLSKLALLSPKQRTKMGEFRNKHMTYCYCYDRKRYPMPPPECDIETEEAKLFRQSGEAKFGSHHHRHGKRSRARWTTNLQAGM